MTDNKLMPARILAGHTSNGFPAWHPWVNISEETTFVEYTRAALAAPTDEVREIPEALAYFKPPFKYESLGQTIYCTGANGSQMALQVRGWGNLTGCGAEGLPSDKAAKIQDQFGQWVSDAMNDALRAATAQKPVMAATATKEEAQKALDDFNKNDFKIDHTYPTVWVDCPDFCVAPKTMDTIRATLQSYIEKQPDDAEVAKAVEWAKETYPDSEAVQTLIRAATARPSREVVEKMVGIIDSRIKTYRAKLENETSPEDTQYAQQFAIEALEIVKNQALALLEGGE